MTADNGDTLREVDDLFRRMMRKFVKERDRIAVEGVTLPSLMILHKIIRDGEQKLSDLAEQMDFTSGAITAICDKLEKQGFAVRRRLAEDRRTIMLDITDSGRAMIRRQGNIGPCSMKKLFAGLSPEELSVQRDIYRRILRNLDGFAEQIVSLAKANERRDSLPETAADRPQEPGSNRFLTY